MAAGSAILDCIAQRERGFHGSIGEAKLQNDLMDEENQTQHWGNSSTSDVKAITFMELALGSFILVSFLVGTVVNGFFLWVLRVKMARKVNTFWFLHLDVSYLICCLSLPFFAVTYLHGGDWIFGVAMCKLNVMFFSLGMYNTVFLLTLISLDRYLFTCHPTWSRRHRTLPWARRLVTGTWVASLALLSPYLAFMDTKEWKGRTVCASNYALSSDWGHANPGLKYRVSLAFFLLRFLLAFVLPFLTIMTCYYCMGQEMRRRLARMGKPYKVLVAAVTSFFICRFPFYLYNASRVFKAPQETQEVLQVIFTTCTCLNICITPFLYLFVGEKFQNVFKMSTVSLLRRGFTDLPTIPGDSENTAEEGHHINGGKRLVQTLTPGSDLACHEDFPLDHV
ncbi:probable G-protein coupled receptor 33 [Hemicordylus capensis]|uniref:probable G-protein coupled receptor 33 n=1 Tax=Hemicordylus capensis TaxID=884348 RepID=UPI0023043CF0|nr:probable G-protein coupled receptor 33 [Hemicordylus capensis]